MAAWPALALAMAAASAGSGPGQPQPPAPAPAPATAAGVEAEYQRQRALCEALTVAAVRAECLRQAERSRAQALKALQGGAAAPPLSGSSARSG